MPSISYDYPEPEREKVYLVAPQARGLCETGMGLYTAWMKAVESGELEQVADAFDEFVDHTERCEACEETE